MYADSGTNVGILVDVSLILQASFSVIKKKNRTKKGLPAVPSSCYKNGMKLCEHHFIVTKYPKYQTNTQKTLLPGFGSFRLRSSDVIAWASDEEYVMDQVNHTS